DRGDDLLVIDDPPTVVAGQRSARHRHQIYRDANPLPLLTLAPADADAAQQNQATHGNGVAGAGRGRLSMRSRRAELDHYTSMPSQTERRNAFARRRDILA